MRLILFILVFGACKINAQTCDLTVIQNAKNNISQANFHEVAELPFSSCSTVEEFRIAFNEVIYFYLDRNVRIVSREILNNPSKSQLLFFEIGSPLSTIPFISNLQWRLRGLLLNKNVPKEEKVILNEIMSLISK
jgi:hypothetical protein